MEVQTGKIISAQQKTAHFMLASKIVILIAVVVLYVMQLSLALPLFGAVLWNTDQFGEMNNERVIFLLVLLIVALVLDFISFIFAIIGAVRQEKPVTKMSIVIKALMIPFFLLNICLWCMTVLGMLNPFLMFGIPLIICVGCALTYAYMFMTSWPDIIYMIIYTIKSKRRPKAPMVWGIILEFFFVVDIIGCILIHRAYKKSLEENV